ncbi:hypothetical protein cyc_07757 [Cyclospora cayetanensis]|uniref:Uncharacterized protein n=1 Tax=Cyclospora cayetanensis TaxID=88456 RepID=A0A1D3D1R7_9EIME|nr:hypothetical protein cyc_07757 [Cyclospora cayetanensis]
MLSKSDELLRARRHARLEGSLEEEAAAAERRFSPSNEWEEELARAFRALRCCRTSRDGRSGSFICAMSGPDHKRPSVISSLP